ncbi:hypothetical protein [Planomonospora parontospora]|uniref:hypothetical protein n=1 Tax=Planomonospora parontospora TaxID=58119 RepID=UPI00167012E1|nr:hypothetical protein [Planomonospora parontospora]GGL42599.1 hypothetical protein GCM10014719_49880 [Planomonospora parontospora subsp. antibiotica]GII18373.1 hypothetical protein Ppa05_50990 [Planomonospora parontospora subsp. antibiotica]
MTCHPPSRTPSPTSTARYLAAIAAVVAVVLGGITVPAFADPAPTPVPSPSPQVSWIAPSPPPQEGECDLLDVGCKINEAVNGWFTDLVTDAISPAFSLLAQTLLSSPPPSILSRVRELTGQVTVVANALLVLFVLAGGVIVMAYGSAQTSTTAKEVAPRLVVAAILLNGSLTVSEYAVRLANGLVHGLLGDGVNAERAGNLLASKVLDIVRDPDGTVLYLVVIAGVSVLMGTILVFIAIIRITLLLFLIIAAPLALLCHALPQTEGIAKLWWRGFIGVLAMQVLQALVLILAFTVHLTDSQDAFTSAGVTTTANQTTTTDALDVLILIGLMYVLIKIPGWVARSIWQQAKPQLLMRIVKAVVVYKTLGAIGGALRKSRTAAKASGRLPHRGGPAGGAGGRGPKGTGPRPSSPSSPSPRPSPGGPHASGGTPTMNPSPSGGSANASGSPRPASNRTAQQLQLPLGIPPAAPSSASARQGRQLALPFPVTRLPRPTAPVSAPPPPTGPWIRPRPPYRQDRLPGMPTRPARPRQLHLRLDPPPRRILRNRGER